MRERDTNTEEGLKWPKRLDENVCSCPYLKDAEKYIADDEADGPT